MFYEKHTKTYLKINNESQCEFIYNHIAALHWLHAFTLPQIYSMHVLEVVYFFHCSTSISDIKRPANRKVFSTCAFSISHHHRSLPRQRELAHSFKANMTRFTTRSLLKVFFYISHQRQNASASSLEICILYDFRIENTNLDTVLLSVIVRSSFLSACVDGTERGIYNDCGYVLKKERKNTKCKLKSQMVRQTKTKECENGIRLRHLKDAVCTTFSLVLINEIAPSWVVVRLTRWVNLEHISQKAIYAVYSIEYKIQKCQPLHLC